MTVKLEILLNKRNEISDRIDELNIEISDLQDEYEVINACINEELDIENMLNKIEFEKGLL